MLQTGTRVNKQASHLTSETCLPKCTKIVLEHCTNLAYFLLNTHWQQLFTTRMTNIKLFAELAWILMTRVFQAVYVDGLTYFTGNESHFILVYMVFSSASHI